MEFTRPKKVDMESLINVDLNRPSTLKTVLQVPHERSEHITKDGQYFAQDYQQHINEGKDSIIVVGAGIYTMHYCVALTVLRCIPAKNIFIVEKSDSIGGCSVGGHDWAFWGAPFLKSTAYPLILYASCYYKLHFTPYGINTGIVRNNLRIIHEHFGLRTYLKLDFNDVKSILVPDTRVVHPKYRDIVNGRAAGQLAGALDNVDLQPNRFNLIGGGASVADVAVELSLRRCKAYGDEFVVAIHYRRVRNTNTWLGGNCIDAGVTPAYALRRMRLLIDEYMFSQVFPIAPQLERHVYALQESEREHNVKSKGVKSGATGFSCLFLAHPFVARRLRFVQIRDRKDVPTPHIDCTNLALPNWNHADPDYEQHPDEGDFVPFLRFTADGSRLGCCLFGQLGTPYGAIAHVLYPKKIYDTRICIPYNVGGGNSQYDGTDFFAKFHSVPKFFMFIGTFRPAKIQQLMMITYDFMMHLLAFTGFTLFLFHEAEFKRSPPFSLAVDGYEVARARWEEWFNGQIQGKTLDAVPFPYASIDEMPGVGDCFSYVWMLNSKQKLKHRMILTCTILIVSFQIDYVLIGFATVVSSVALVTAFSGYAAGRAIEDRIGRFGSGHVSKN